MKLKLLLQLLIWPKAFAFKPTMLLHNKRCSIERPTDYEAQLGSNDPFLIPSCNTSLSSSLLCAEYSKFLWNDRWKYFKAWQVVRDLSITSLLAQGITPFFANPLQFSTKEKLKISSLLSRRKSFRGTDCKNWTPSKKCGDEKTQKLFEDIVSKLQVFTDKIFKDMSLIRIYRYEWHLSSVNNPHLHFDTYSSHSGGNFRLFVNLGSRRVWAMSYNITQAFEYSHFFKSLTCRNPTLHFLKNEMDKSVWFQKHICKEFPSHIFHIPFGTIWITDGKLNSHQVLSGSRLLVASLNIPKKILKDTYLPPDVVLRTEYNKYASECRNIQSKIKK